MVKLSLIHETCPENIEKDARKSLLDTGERIAFSVPC
jgi:hypothetical protein